jgi:hypothetical protein
MCNVVQIFSRLISSVFRFAGGSAGKFSTSTQLRDCAWNLAPGMICVSSLVFFFFFLFAVVCVMLHLLSVMSTVILMSDVACYSGCWNASVKLNFF